MSGVVITKSLPAVTSYPKGGKASAPFVAYPAAGAAILWMASKALSTNLLESHVISWMGAGTGGIAWWLVNGEVSSTQQSPLLHAKMLVERRASRSGRWAVAVRLVAHCTMGSATFWMVQYAWKPRSPHLHRVSWAGAAAGLTLWVGRLELDWRTSDFCHRLSKRSPLPPGWKERADRLGLEVARHQKRRPLESKSRAAALLDPGMAPSSAKSIPYLHPGFNTCWFNTTLTFLIPALDIQSFYDEVHREDNPPDLWHHFREIYKKIYRGVQRITWAEQRPAHDAVFAAMPTEGMAGTFQDPAQPLQELFMQLPPALRERTGFAGECTLSGPQNIRFERINPPRDPSKVPRFKNRAQVIQNLEAEYPASTIPMVRDVLITGVHPEVGSLQRAVDSTLFSGRPESDCVVYLENRKRYYRVHWERQSERRRIGPVDVLPFALNRFYYNNGVQYLGTPMEIPKVLVIPGNRTHDGNPIRLRLASCSFYVNNNHHIARTEHRFRTYEHNDQRGPREVEGLNPSTAHCLLYIRCGARGVPLPRD